MSARTLFGELSRGDAFASDGFLESQNSGLLHSALQRAVQIALRQFHRRYNCLYNDAEEWRRECEQEAWLAVLTYASDKSIADHDKIDDLVVLILANHAYNALRVLWRRENSHRQHCIPLAVRKNGSSDESSAEDYESVYDCVDEIIEQIFCDQIVTCLRAHISQQDWVIICGLAEGRTQTELAKELGISQQAVSKRLARIRQWVRENIGGCV
jgi:RNA polymerase sigma factor (sigma-70 family)